MTRKKLMILGGSRYAVPVVEAAHRLGVHVITADYLPDNEAHRVSDEYCNVSVVDKEAILASARQLRIDGIMSFACDPGVVTAAFVAEKLGLPSPPLKSVEILQNKDRFRDFLAANGFNCPWHKGYSSADAALRELSADAARFPLIVKPVDSAGSKGCRRVNSPAELADAIDAAIAESHSGRFIAEQFLEKAGSSSDTDSFSIDNELVFCSFNCQHFDADAANPFTPSAFSWPSDMPDGAQKELRCELQRLVILLDLGTSIYNIETRVATDGKAYIMEVSPRGGGNRLAEILRLATGQNLIENCVRGALGMSMLPMSDPSYNGAWAELIVHSNKAGQFVALDIDSDFAAKHLVQNDLWVKLGDSVAEFTGANKSIGTLILKFDSHDQAEHYLSSAAEWIEVKTS